MLSDGYNLTNTSRLAVSILANKSTSNRLFNFEFDKAIEEEVTKIAPLASERPIAQYIYDTTKENYLNDVYFYAAFAGLSLPKRIMAINEEIIRLDKLVNQNQPEEVDMFAALSTPTTEDHEEDIPFDDLFENPNQDAKKQLVEDDIMDNFLNS